VQDIVLAEGEALSLPLAASEADGDALTSRCKTFSPARPAGTAQGNGRGRHGSVHDTWWLVGTDGHRAHRQPSLLRR
jgi:hypothetical protein